ncbi:MAG: S-layer homology domain-containing protein, partial [Butyricicoccus sp.]
TAKAATTTVTALSQLYRSAAPAQAVENAENAAATVTATVQHAETGQITAQIEAYMTDPANKTRTVKPCDIIFLIEQSQFMNTHDSANPGGERAEILSAMESLLNELPTPTTPGGEHRIAIAGYGRINNPGIGDSYDAALYPGTLSDNNASLNTGYYTKDGLFHSQSKWTECDGKDDASLPQLPSNYLTDNYDNVFLSADNAKQVIDANTMVPWYAGAARMDAGLTITERLASIAKAHKSTGEAAGEDRNLIVCIAASSLPYQNNGTYQKLRPEAAKAAANMLKETYDATIFGLGDFHQLNLESSNPLHDVDKQRDNFNSTMASICGNASTTNGADYFKGLSQVNNINEALKELITQIDANVGEGTAEELSIRVNSFNDGEINWSQLKHVHHILSAKVASVDYYHFTGYDSNGTPQFKSTPYRHTEQNLADIDDDDNDDAIQTSLNILPIPPQAHAGEIRGANYGEKVVITITGPICIRYKWISMDNPTDVAPPANDYIRTGRAYTAKAQQNSHQGYTFDGWYTDEECTQPFVDGTVLNTDTVLYGRWTRLDTKTVTFKVQNGKWSDGTSVDKTVTVKLRNGLGTLSEADVPTGMTPDTGYKAPGGWEQTPNTAPNGITGDVTYVYRFSSTGGGSSSSHHSTRYTLHYESNGGTAYKDERCSSGTKVTLDKTPTRESYTFTGWYADKALTQKITTVTMNSDKTVYAGWEATGVPDKLNGDDHFAYVIGYPDGKVHPEGNISRAETATIFFRLLKADIRDGNLTADNGFSDVSDGQWHNKAVSTMAKLGIVKGRRADRFDPNASITRAEFAAICARFSTRTVENSGSFSDISGHWAENEIERAAAFGWISGYPDGTFRPDARITRAEAMTMINRVLCRMPQSKSDLLDSMVTWSDNKPSDWHYLAVQEATNSHDFDRQGEVGESWTKLTSVPDWTRYQ